MFGGRTIEVVAFLRKIWKPMLKRKIDPENDHMLQVFCPKFWHRTMRNFTATGNLSLLE